MHTVKSTWPGAMAGAVLTRSALLLNYGSEVFSTRAQAASTNQLTVMIDKINQTIVSVGQSLSKPSLPPADVDHPSAARFVVAFPGAVLDKQTRLVWEEVPDVTPRTRTDATRYCIDKTVGGTIGWRLPSTVELKSVQETSMASTFAKALIGGSASYTFPAWCVRGGVNTEQF